MRQPLEAKTEPMTATEDKSFPVCRMHYDTGGRVSAFPMASDAAYPIM